jgi:multiple sugar transport system substrate-binding protein
MRDKKWIAKFLVLVAVLGAAVAASAGAQTSRSTATLNIYGYGPGDDVQENRAAYAASQLNGVTINRQAPNFDDQVFLTQLASGSVPDLVRMSRPSVGQYAAKGVLQPVDSCVADVKSQYRAGALKAMSWKGHIYGLPEFTNQVTLIVNTSAFASAGVPVSDAQVANKKKLLATTKKLVKFDGSGNLTRIGFDPKIDSTFGLALWVKWFGGKNSNIISADGLHAQLNSKDAVAALAFAVQLINAQGGWNKFKSFRDTMDFFGAQNPLVKDQLAFWPMESFIYNTFSNNSPNADLQAKFFTNSKGGPITFFSGNGWVIPKGSGDFQDACNYMKAVTSVQAWETAAKKRFDARKAAGQTFTGLFTANTVADKKVYEDIYQPFGHAQFDKAVPILVAASKYGFELPPTPAGSKFTDAYNAAIQRVLTGQQTPKQALDQAQKEAQAAIDANK